MPVMPCIDARSRCELNNRFWLRPPIDQYLTQCQREHDDASSRGEKDRDKNKLAYRDENHFLILFYFKPINDLGNSIHRPGN